MPVRLRPAKRGDAAQLAVLMDIASRGLVSRIWQGMAKADESPLEIGRSRIIEHKAIPSHYSNWIVADLKGQVAGAYAGYIVPEPYDPGDISDLPLAYTPLLELEALASGSWFLAVLAVFPEFRQQGLARRLLHSAERVAQRSGAPAMTLTVSDSNTLARDLYLKEGFARQAQRKRIFLPPEDGREDEWLLLGKALPA